MRRNIVWRGVLLALALTLLAGCGAPSGPSGSGSGAENLTLLTIGTADSGGTMYQAGSAIAQVITQEDSSIKINISASSGSNQNVRLLDSGEVDLALVSGDVAYAALHGERDFQTPVEGLRAIAAVLADRTDERAVLREITDLLEAWGVPVAPAENSCYHEENP